MMEPFPWDEVMPGSGTSSCEPQSWDSIDLAIKRLHNSPRTPCKLLLLCPVIPSIWYLGWWLLPARTQDISPLGFTLRPSCWVLSDVGVWAAGLFRSLPCFSGAFAQMLPFVTVWGPHCPRPGEVSVSQALGKLLSWVRRSWYQGICPAQLQKILRQVFKVRSDCSVRQQLPLELSNSYPSSVPEARQREANI